MEFHSVTDASPNHKRKLIDNLLGLLSDDWQSCKYRKTESEKPVPIKEICHSSQSDEFLRRAPMQQYALNLQKSGIPERFMYYDKGQWIDYPDEAISAMLECFVARRSFAKVSIKGKVYVVNFVYMIQINLSSGFFRSIAWMDKSGKCFTPSKCVEGHCAESLLFGQKVQVTADESKYEVTPKASVLQKRIDFGKLGDKLIKLVQNDLEFTSVKDKFFSGLSLFAKDAMITRIYKVSYASLSGQGRLQAFKIQEKIMAERRGDADVRYAWHGTSKEAVFGIIMHGFGQPRVPKNGAAYGVGVYLAPENSSHMSAVYSDVDEDGEQHMVLCHVVMGRMEQVIAGSQQFHPSHEDFDTGVDDANHPKRHIVWSTHMNTHILPLFVVSFKLAPLSRDVILAAQRGKQALRECFMMGRLATSEVGLSSKAGLASTNELSCYVESTIKACQGRKSCNEETESMFGESAFGSCVTTTAVACDVRQSESNESSVSLMSPCTYPRSPWISFPELLPLLESKLEPQAMGVVWQLYLRYQVDKLPRNLFVKKLRRLLGDDFLRDCIKNRSRQGVPNGSSHTTLCG